MISSLQLNRILPWVSQTTLDKFIDPLNRAMEAYDIITPLRQAAFIAQIAHESGSFRYVEEIASGKAYEGRADLGNTQPGDGVRFKGRGLIQITGRANYKACGEALGRDFLSHPEELESAKMACRSAAWFWYTHGLNALADDRAFRKITKRINGGYNGLEEREKLYAKARDVLGIKE